MFRQSVYEEQRLRVIRTLSAKKYQIAAAEIGTGGYFAQQFAAVPDGAGQVFRCGMVALDRKSAVQAGVPPRTCRKYGLCAKETAAALAHGIRRRERAEVGAGFSGPADGSGPFWAAVSVRRRSKAWIAVRMIPAFPGKGRQAQQEAAVQAVFELLDGFLAGDPAVTKEFEPAKKYRYCCDSALPVRFLRFFIPWRGDKAGDAVVKLLLLAAVAVGGWSLYQLTTDMARIHESAQVLERAVKTMEQKPSEEQVSTLPEGYLDKFAAAYEVNPEIAGWINIPNTNMNLPVLQHEDNDYYLDHNFEGDYDPNGAPFMDFRNNARELDDNTLIYGHNWESGQMFHSLLLYEDVEFYKQNPVITFDTVYEESQWKVISCLEANTDANIGEVFNYWNFIRTDDPEKMQWYIDEVLARSFFTTTVDVNTDDKLLTIQTCANDRYNTKVCLVARKVRPGESAEVDVEGAAANPDRVKPVRY